MFLTGQSDIMGVCKRLEAEFGTNAMKGKRGGNLGVPDGGNNRSCSLRTVDAFQGCVVNPSTFLFPNPCYSSPGSGRLRAL